MLRMLPVDALDCTRRPPLPPARPRRYPVGMEREFDPDANEERTVPLVEDEELPVAPATLDPDERIEDDPDLDPEAPLSTGDPE